MKFKHIFSKEELENGRDLSKQEVEDLIQSFNEELAQVNEEIITLIEKNDYVQLTQLLERRKQLVSLIDVIESSRNESTTSAKHGKGIHQYLKASADFTSTTGEELVDQWYSALEKVNERSHDVLSTTLDKSHTVFQIGNHLQHRIGKSFIRSTSRSLKVMAYLFNKKS